MVDGYCVRWNKEKECCESPSTIIHMCNGYIGPGKCLFKGDMKEEFTQKLPTLTVLKRPCTANYRPVVEFYSPNWGLMS